MTVVCIEQIFEETESVQWECCAAWESCKACEGCETVTCEDSLNNIGDLQLLICSSPDTSDTLFGRYHIRRLGGLLRRLSRSGTSLLGELVHRRVRGVGS